MKTPISLFISFALALVLTSGCSTTVDEKAAAGSKIHYDIGVSLLHRGDRRGALRELMEAVDRNPYNSKAYNALGLTYHSLGKPKLALVQYQKAVELDPKFSEAFNNMGTLLMDMARYDEAIASFKVAINDILYETPYMAEGNMGWAYYSKGDIKPALRHLRNATATNPHFCRGYEWLMRIGLKEDKTSLVIANGARFKKYCLNNEIIRKKLPAAYIQTIHYFMAQGYLKDGDISSAREAYAKCIQSAANEETTRKCSRGAEAAQ
ncbi:tetratricopeptide repeat protein [Myxococcota bacterium]|nr:tetratricopeptide repeat protein [Myxococcota bacterium]